MNSSSEQLKGLIQRTATPLGLVVLLVVGVIISCSDSPANDGVNPGQGDVQDDQGVIRPQPDTSTDREDDDAEVIDAELDLSTDLTPDDIEDEELGPQSPVANAGDDITTRAGTPVELSAAASYDPDGTIDSYQWTFGDGTSDLGQVVFHTYATHGAYIVQLTVTDNDGLTNTDTLLADIQEFNEAPRAVIRSPDVIIAGEEAELNASDSTDDGTITSFLWNVGVEGIEPIEGETLNYTWIDWGPYTVSLTVTDDLDQTDTYNLPIIVLARPTAVITAPSSAYVGEEVEFSSLSSTDEDGDIISQHWLFPDDSAESTGTLPSHTFATVGEWEVVLTVTDDDDLTHSTTHKIAILPPPNECPVANINLGELPHEWLTNEWVESSGESSTDDGMIDTYEWDWGDGSEVEFGATQSHEYTDDSGSGAYTITLTVTDDDGCTYVEGDLTTALAQTTADVVILNRAPVADLDTIPALVVGEPVRAAVGEMITFDARGSSDARGGTDDGTIVSYTLTFGDMVSSPLTSGSDPPYTIEHSYGSADTYTATLTVQDDDEVPDTAELEVIVADPEPTNRFDLDDLMIYVCAGGAVHIEFDQVAVIINESDISITPTSPEVYPGTFEGTITGADFGVTWSMDGQCNETYTITGTFSDDDAFDGYFTREYVNNPLYIPTCELLGIVCCMDCTNTSAPIPIHAERVFE